MQSICREDMAWAGGLFEGEGCITIWHKPNSNETRPGVQMASTDLDVLEKFRDIVGFGTICPRTRRVAHYKQSWAWASSSFIGTQALVAMLWPWLGERRRARAKEVLLATRIKKPLIRTRWGGQS